MRGYGPLRGVGGTAYAVNTVGSADIIDGEVKSVDIGNNEIGSSDVKDNSLNTFDVHSFLGVDVVDGTLDDRDVGRSAYTFNTIVGVVNASDCKEFIITGLNQGTSGDHLVLTPLADTTHAKFTYDVATVANGDSSKAVLKVCNPSNIDSNGGTTNFKLLVIAQRPPASSSASPTQLSTHEASGVQER